jgi:hypothetical protein
MAAFASTLTIRLTSEEASRLRKRARAAGTTPSAVVRSMIDRDLGEADVDEQTLGEKSRRWVGSIRSERVARGRAARKTLASWNPDRRG